MDENRNKALAAALSQIEKQFGKGSIMRLGDSDNIKDIEVISTGSLGLDIALGVGGLPNQVIWCEKQHQQKSNNFIPYYSTMVVDTKHLAG